MSEKIEQFNDESKSQLKQDAKEPESAQQPLEELSEKEVSEGGKIKMQITDLQEKQLAEEQLREFERKERELLTTKWMEQKRATDTVEYFLERQKSETSSEKPPEQAAPAKITRRNFLRGIAAVAGLALGGGVLYEAGKEGLRRHKNATEGPEIMERTGVDLKKIAENYGFDADLEVDNANGPYIVHIGQKHAHPTDKAKTLMAKEEIIEVQKDIEGAVIAILESGRIGREVYFEGFEANFTPQEFLKVKGRIAEIKPTVKNYILLSETASIETDSICSYLYFQKLEKISKYFNDNPPIFKAGDKFVTEERFNKVKANVEFLLKERKDRKSIFYSADDIYVDYGAAVKLFLDGRITSIQSAEDKEVHKKAMSSFKENGIVKENRRYLLRDREDIAVQKIGAAFRGNNRGMTLLIYGCSHDFKDAVEEQNKSNPGKKLGLIRLTPKKSE